MSDVDPLDAARTALAPDGVLHAAINLGNPVLAQGTPEDPAGVTVEIARTVAQRLGVPLSTICSDAARDSFAALVDGRAAVGFLAVEPARAEQVAFTAPYVLIEGVFVVPEAAPFAGPDDVDADGVRVGVKLGSAYDLYLTRTLDRAAIVRGTEGVTTYVDDALEAGAGIRQPVTAFVADHPGHRILEPAFMQIRQAVAVRREQPDDVVAWLHAVVEELKADGSIAAALTASGQVAAVAPPA